MKTMTCKQLGGACDQEFRAYTFEEIAELSKNHGMEMFPKKGRGTSKSYGRNTKINAIARRNEKMV
ncbi:hypothetical protein [Maribacter sp. 2210JD10-5]|uniref:hypothetical protein n=1 Tax=Maribacter sp. 2210JD10-5 TaxID=3386272 RepID=UPI0039BC267D